MLEIEQKYQRVDHESVARVLQQWGVPLQKEQTEADHYFNAPDRDFASTDEAFRLRRVGSTNLLTYKGPKQRAAVKVRTELEVPIAEGDEPAEQMTQLVIHLGYRPVTVVRKHRRFYSLQRGEFAITVCLDAVDDLGNFVEIEILAPEERKEQATPVLLQLANELGLKDVQPRSYLSLVLEKQGLREDPVESPVPFEDCKGSKG